MTATTDNYNIPYPTADDRIKNLPTHLKDLAQTTDTAIQTATNAAIAADVPPLVVNAATTMPSAGQPGQTGLLTTPTAAAAAKGLYWHDGSQWTRGTYGNGIFTPTPNDYCSITCSSWLMMGVPHLLLRLLFKKALTSNVYFELGRVPAALAPPFFMRLPFGGNVDDTSQYNLAIGQNGVFNVDIHGPSINMQANASLTTVVCWPCAQTGATLSTTN